MSFGTQQARRSSRPSARPFTVVLTFAYSFSISLKKMLIEKSFKHLNSWREQFIKQAGIPSNESFPFIVFGNKADLSDQRVVSKERALEFCKQGKGTQYFEVSAKDSSNVIKAFEEVAREAIKNSLEEDEYVPTSVVFNPGVKFSKNVQKRSCC